MSGIPLTHKIFAFIQARTGSSRLPKKVINNFIKNLTILDLLLDRVKQVLPLEKICLLIPEGDQELKEFAKDRKINFFQGSELDVRDRFIQAAKYFEASWILRLTGDNPFVDSKYLGFLIESTRFTRADGLSFLNLPLGTSGEIFFASAIEKEPKTGLESRHSEHVSLHLKEYPQEYKFLKLNPFFSLEEQEICKKIRVTIDEQKDWQACQEIYNYFQHNDFGIKELIELYKQEPKIFQTNQEVKQVSFPLSPEISQNKGKIGITCAPRNLHGSGHLSRMQTLAIYLQALEFKVHFREEFEKPELDLEILDYRDKELPESFLTEKWIKIDNFGTKQGKEIFFYSLPHPSLKPVEYNENFFGSLSLELVKYTPSFKKKGVCIYAGGLDEEACVYLDKWTSENFPNSEILRIGGQASKLKNVVYKPRLTPYDFFSSLKNSEIFITYFGQSLFEALYLNTPCLTYSISSYHEELSYLAKDTFHVPYLGNVLLENFKTYPNDFNFINPSFQAEGYKKLIELILKKLEK